MVEHARILSTNSNVYVLLNTQGFNVKLVLYPVASACFGINFFSVDLKITSFTYIKYTSKSELKVILL